MGSASQLERGPVESTGRESLDEMIARMLVGAAERIHSDVLDAQRLGIIDAEGRLLSKDLPDDMKPGAQRDFGG